MGGGMGDAGLDAVADIRNVVVKKLAVNAVPRSGPPMELLEMFGISASCISKAVTELISLEVDSHTRTNTDPDGSTEPTPNFKDCLLSFKDRLHLINTSM